MTHRRYTSQSLTAGTLWFAGDILSQRLTWSNGSATMLLKEEHLSIAEATDESPEPKSFGLSSIDWRRAAVMTSFGLFIAGPLYTFWYRLLDEKMVHLVTKWVCSPCAIRRASCNCLLKRAIVCE